MREFQSALRSEERSDSFYLCIDKRLTLFQSALRSEERSDVHRARSDLASRRFQSALRSEERSDAKCPRYFTKADVSIRASLRRAKRWWRECGGDVVMLFQSALRSEERSDAEAAAGRASAACFNPRFAPKSEAILTIMRRPARCPCFNPRFAPKSEAMRVALEPCKDL